jgi:hypothetical protein
VKRFRAMPVAVVVIALLAAAPLILAQTTFKVPFDFEAGGKKLPKGEYTVTQKGEAQVTLKQLSTGREVEIPVLNKLEQPKPPVAEPRLVFDAVGNFEPSYTEYFTVYILAEVWFPGQAGLELHVTKGAHQTKIVKGEAAK